MSGAAIKWARGVRVASGSTKSVLVHLALRADESGQCWPSQETLADEACMSVRSVRRALAELEALGLISRTERRGGGVYRSDLVRLNLGVLMPGFRKPARAVPGATGDLFGPPAPPAPAANLAAGLRPPCPEPAANVAAKETGVNPSGKGRAVRARKSLLPDDFSLTGARLEVAVAHGLSETAARVSMAKFVERQKETRRESFDWEASWAGWCVEAARRQAQSAASAAPAAAGSHPVQVGSPEAAAWERHLGRALPFYGRFSRTMPSRWPPGYAAPEKAAA